MLLRSDSLSFGYRTQNVLDGAWCNLDRGETVILAGRNGCGKSTFFKLLLGLLKASQGVIKIDERYVPPRQRFRYIAWLPQESFLPARLRLGALLRMLEPFPNPVLDLARLPELAALKHTRIAALSTGERRLAELLVILNQDKPLILLDEPFTGLQPSTIDRVSQAIIEKKQRGYGIILCDHQYQAAFESADRCLFLQDGRIHALDPAAAGQALRGAYIP